MLRQSPFAPCHGFAIPLSFPDVEPDVLAREAQADPAPSIAGAWMEYLRRTLPATQPDRSAEATARAMLDSAGDAEAARRAAEAERSRAIASGSVGQVRFWARVLESLREHAPA